MNIIHFEQARQNKKVRDLETNCTPEEILTQIFCDETMPGTIIEDTNTLINFLKSNELIINSNSSTLPGQCLEDINNALSKTIKLDFKRRTMHSYPNITGIYWLLRTLRLISFEKVKNKKRVTIEQDSLERWLKLSSTDQYWTLLTSWLSRGCVETINANERSRGPDAIQEFYTVIAYVMMDFGEFLTHRLNRTNLSTLSLLEMFGLVTVEDDKPHPGKGWNIENAELTPLGYCVSEVLSDNSYYPEYCRQVEVDKIGDKSDNRLQMIFSKLVLNWNKFFLIRDKLFVNATYSFSIKRGYKSQVKKYPLIAERL